MKSLLLSRCRGSPKRRRLRREGVLQPEPDCRLLGLNSRLARADNREVKESEQERIHFVGIGGAGMSGLARLFLAEGKLVSGSDQKASPTLEALRRAGAEIHVGHAAENVAGAGCVVFTTACREDNPEVAEARRLGLPLLSRPELLGQVMAARRGIAVAGTHGKTTTTGMIASIFLTAGLDPAVLVGGDLAFLDGNTHAGRGPHLIAEACEAYGSFLHLRPSVAVLTNVEADHLDWYGTSEAVDEAFRRFLAGVAVDGAVIVCADDPGARRTARDCGRRLLEYGLEAGEISAADLEREGLGAHFTLTRHRERLADVTLRVPGRHNVRNALGAAAAALEEGIPLGAIQEGLHRFQGAGRRFEMVGETGGVKVIDDYAHHPTEIRATLSAARQAFDGPLTAVFQPHLYSRTRDLMPGFAESLASADRIVVTEVYAAREDPLPGITGSRLADAVRAAAPDREVLFASDLTGLGRDLHSRLGAGEVLITLGAGDVRRVAEEFLRAGEEVRPCRD